jgi:hypothetical protein
MDSALLDGKNIGREKGRVKGKNRVEDKGKDNIFSWC